MSGYFDDEDCDFIFNFNMVQVEYYKTYNILPVYKFLHECDIGEAICFPMELKWLNDRIDLEDGQIDECNIMGISTGVTPISLFECINGRLPTVDELDVISYYRLDFKTTPSTFLENAFNLLAWQTHVEDGMYAMKTHTGFYYHIETYNGTRLVKLNSENLIGDDGWNLSHDEFKKWLNDNNY